MLLNKVLKTRFKSFFVAEMPNYKLPLFKNVALNVVEKTKAFIYGAAALRSPFQPPVKVDTVSRVKGAPEVRPDESRVKQFLEGFNIEAFEMVGTLSNDSGFFARVGGAGGVHRVKVGDYLGRNHGRVVSVDEAKIDVIEIVPDGDQGWLERPRSLTLKERS